MKTQPKDEFPLKGILRSPCCGQSMTAGWSKGKNKYYLYYRCIKHSNVNISGAVLHEKFNKLLINLNFTQDAIDEVVIDVKGGLSAMNETRNKEAKVIIEQLARLEEKIESTEKKLIDDTINGATYKKWNKKFTAERTQLLKRRDELDEDLEDFINQELLVLPYMLNLPGIFEEASINQQYAILNEVFKRGFTFKEGMFRTPYVHSEFAHNLQRLKQLGLI